MKFKKYLFGVFIFSFVTGCLSVYLIASGNFVLRRETKQSAAPKTIERVETETLQNDVEKPFAPEITGLPDFSDETDSPKHKLKLVDVAAHGSDYRRSEVIAKNGENWLGLYADEGESYLKNTKVRVIVSDDAGNSEEASAAIKFKEQREPLFLLKNAKKLKPGKITTLFQIKPSEEESVYDESNIMRRGFFREYRIGEKRYTLRLTDALTKSGERVMALVLETGNVKQVVTYGFYFEDGGNFLGHLFWVGDLDADGKLDIYMNFNDYEKGSFRSNLFLSSEAEEGKLVKEAAGFYTMGC